MEALGSNKNVAVPLARRIVKYRLNRSKDEPGSSEVTSQVVVRLRRAMAVTNIVSLSEREIEKLEGHGATTMKTEEEKLHLDDYQIKILRELGLQDKDDNEDPYSLVSYK